REISVREVKIAGKPTRLISVKETPEDDNKPQAKEQNGRRPAVTNAVLLLSAIDANTVLVSVLSKADQAEALVRRYANPPARSLAINALLGQTAALLPKQPQVAVYLSFPISAAAFGLGAAALADSPSVGFALSTFRPGVEAQFVIPYGTIEKVFEAARHREE